MGVTCVRVDSIWVGWFVLLRGLVTRYEQLGMWVVVMQGRMVAYEWCIICKKVGAM